MTMPTKATLAQENVALRRRIAKLKKQLAAHAGTHTTAPDALPLVENEKNLRAFFNTIDHLLFVLDAQGNILLTNDTVTRKLGYTLDELRGQSVLQVHPPERRAEAARIVGEMLAGTADYCPVPLVAKDGRHLSVETRVVKGTWSEQPVIFGVTKDLSEIKASEEKFSRVFHASPAPMALTDTRTGKYIAVNETFLRLLGYSREQVLDKTALELNLFVNPQQRTALLQEMQRQGYLRNEPVLVRTHAGDVRQGIFSAEFVRLQDQTLLLTVMDDVTERRQMEASLHQSEGRFARAFHSNPAVQLIVAAASGRILDANEAFCQQTGYSREETLGRTTQELGLWIQPDKQQQMIQTLRAGGQVRDIEIQFQRQSGEARTLLFAFEPIELNNAPCIISSGVDITERKRAEQALQEANTRYYALFEQSHDAVFILDLQGRHLEANQRAADMLGYPPAEVIGLSVHDVSAENEPSLRVIERLVAGEHVPLYERFFRKKDGTVFPVEINVELIRDAHGAPVHIQSVVRDITERKQAEQALRRSEERYRTLVNSLDISLCRWLPDTTLTFANERYRRIFGIHDNAIGTQWLDLVPAETRANTAHFYQALAQAPRTVNYEHPVTTEDGKVRHYQWIDTPIFDAHGKLTEFQSIGLDITEHKQTETALRQSEALLSEAQRVGRIGHLEWSATNPNLICSAELHRILELPLDAPITKHTLAEMMSAEDRARLRALDQHYFAARSDLDYEYRVTLASGKQRWLHHQAQVTYAADGKPVRMIGIVQDVTERKQAEEKLRASTERFNTLFYNAPLQAIIYRFIRDANGEVVDWEVSDVNPLGAASIGQAADALIGKRATELFGAQVMAPYFERARQVLATGQAQLFETYFESNQQEYLSSVFMVGPDHYANVSVNITARKQAEQLRNRQATRIQILHELDSAILANEPPDCISNKALELIAPIIPFELGVVLLFDRERSEAWLVAMRGEPTVPYAVGTRGQIDPGMLGVIEQTGTWVTSDPASRPNLDPLTRQILAAGYASLAHSAMQMDGPIYGGIRLFARAEHAFTAEHAEILVEVVSQLAIAIAQTRMREQIQQHTADLEARVKERTAQVQDLYDNAPAGYHSVDADGKIILMNQTELNWLGYPRAQVIGRPITDFLTPPSAATFQTNFARFKQLGETRDEEYEFIRKSGDSFPTVVNRTAVYDERGGFIMSRSTVFNNTERRKAEREIRASRDALNAANRELARASKLKDEFLANMSHELRTPLNAILGFAESLMDQLFGPLNERQLDAMQTIETSGRHLLALINDILDLSKIEAGNITLDVTPVSTQAICEASLIFIRQIALKKQIQVTSTLDLTVEWVAADERRLKQMLVNLLTNAVKFTPAGGRIKLVVEGHAENKTVQFTVQDTGIGIAPEDLTRLFKPFVQVDGSLTRQYEGTGLGLALVARMAEMHGGSVSAESQVGVGSQFTITLPWSDAMQSYTNAPETTPSAAVIPDLPVVTPVAADAPLILIAEDNEANILMLSAYLQAKGYRISIARHGGEALDAVRAERPALILMDLQMPVLDGLEAMRRLRRESNPVLAQIPVLAVTALAMPGDRERALAAGANDYLSKPLNLHALTEIIARLLRAA